MATFTKIFSTKMAAAVATATIAGGAAYKWQQEPQHARNWHSNAHLKYPASANYPDLNGYNNEVASFLTPGVRMHF